MGLNTSSTLLLFLAFAAFCFAARVRSKNVPNLNEEEHVRDKRALKVKLKMTLLDDCNNCCPAASGCCHANGTATGKDGCNCSCECASCGGHGHDYKPGPVGPPCSHVRDRIAAFLSLPISEDSAALARDFFCPDAVVEFAGIIYTNPVGAMGLGLILTELGVTAIAPVPNSDVLYCVDGAVYVTERRRVRFLDADGNVIREETFVTVWRLNGNEYCITYIGHITPPAAADTAEPPTLSPKHLQCISENGNFNPRSNSCYKYYAGGFTQRQAQALCIREAPANMRGRLAFVDGPEDYNLVASTVPSNAWIGISNINPNVKTNFDGTGMDFPYRNEWAFYEWHYRMGDLGWLPGRMYIDNGPDAHCMHFWPMGGGFSDDICSRNWPALCEFVMTTPQEKTCYSIGGGWSDVTNSCFLVDPGQKLTQAEGEAWCRNGAPGGFRGRLAIILDAAAFANVQRLRTSAALLSWIGARVRNPPGVKSEYGNIQGDGNGADFPFRHEWAWYENGQFVANLTWLPPRMLIDNGPSAHCMHYWPFQGGYSDDHCEHRQWAPLCEFVWEGP